MARMKFLCDAERCIECNGCVTACKQEHDIPWGVNRRRVVTINDGVPGERSISVACMHCSDAPCMAVCPVDCFYRTDDGVVLHDKDLCIGCGYCFYACPFGAPQFPQAGAFGVRGKMDKCTFCAGGPEPEQLRGGVQEIRAQSPRRGQAARVRRNVLDQGTDRRRRRRARRNLSDARHVAGQGRRSVGLGNRVRASRGAEAARRSAGGTALQPRRPPEGPNRDPARGRHAGAAAFGRGGGLAGCGERPQVVNTNRASTRASRTRRRTRRAPWNGNKQEWEQALATRNQNQNEYKRIR